MGSWPRSGVRWYLLFGLLSGPILRLFGVPAVLFAVPVVLGVAVGVFAILPGFSTVAVVKVASKTFDYSIFRVAKEILYIPLSHNEKTMGKSLIDILGYRIAKVGTSLLMLGILAWITTLTLVVIPVWLWITHVVVKRFRNKVSRKEELQSV